MRDVLRAGADKVSLNTRAVADPPRIEGALANVPSLDEDRILRQVFNLVVATVRTNFYQADAVAGLPR